MKLEPQLTEGRAIEAYLKEGSWNLEERWNLSLKEGSWNLSSQDGKAMES